MPNASTGRTRPSNLETVAMKIFVCGLIVYMLLLSPFILAYILVEDVFRPPKDVTD